jgi:hypothetical protein
MPHGGGEGYRESLPKGGRAKSFLLLGRGIRDSRALRWLALARQALQRAGSARTVTLTFEKQRDAGRDSHHCIIPNVGAMGQWLYG